MDLKKTGLNWIGINIFLATLLLFSIFSATGLADEGTGYNLTFAQNSSERCVDNRYILGIGSGETLGIGNIVLDSDGIAFGNYGNSSGFFENENIFRNDSKYLEIFDIRPDSDKGKIEVRIINSNSPSSRIPPGSYPYTLTPEFMRINDEIIPGNPLSGEILVKTKLDEVNVNVVGRMNLPNTIIMGENASILFSELGTELDSKEINIKTFYNGNELNHKTLEASDDENQIFNEVASSITGNLQDNIICPRLPLKIIFDDGCIEKELSVVQRFPEASDIYYYVGEYFDTGNSYRIGQIYYMVGAYFNCKRPEAFKISPKTSGKLQET